MAYPSRKRTNKTDLGYRFISLFHEMPGNIYCPQFYILHHAVGCPYRCSYCYLQNTLRGQTYPRWYHNFETMVSETKDWLEKTEKPALLNTGELADSFAVSTEYLQHIVPLFTAQEKHKILFLTKSAMVPEEIPVHPSIRMCWSINADKMARKYEPGAPNTAKRIAAARKAKEMGHHVRIRLDPVIPVTGWEKAYEDLIRELAEFKPDFLTLRTLRCQSNLAIWAQKGHVGDGANPFDDVGDLLVRDGDDKAKRIRSEARAAIYNRLGKVLDESKLEWGLCKETTEVLALINKLGHMCNCLP